MVIIAHSASVSSSPDPDCQCQLSAVEFGLSFFLLHLTPPSLPFLKRPAELWPGVGHAPGAFFRPLFPGSALDMWLCVDRQRPTLYQAPRAVFFARREPHASPQPHVQDAAAP